MYYGNVSIPNFVYGNKQVTGLAYNNSIWPPEETPATYDPDAQAWFDAVVAAGSSISTDNKAAVSAFVAGCKTDGIWTAIKASCLLCAADDLTGALVPLVGLAPTNSGSFVSGDYSRTTGLLGNGTSKYLNSNRNNNADPQNSRHMAVWRTSSESRAANRCAIGTANGTGMGQLITTSTLRIYRSAGADYQISDTSAIAGFYGHSRSASNDLKARYNGSTSTSTLASTTPLNGSITIFSRGGTDSFTDARISFYSIGEAIDLSLLDARLTTLMAALV